MTTLNVDSETADAVRQLARDHGMTVGAVIDFLVQTYREQLSQQIPGGEASPKRIRSGPVAVFMTYREQRTEARFEPSTSSLTITSGSLGGRRYGSPSAAAKAVIRQANPSDSGSRNGWITWFVSQTGNPLQSIRPERQSRPRNQ